MGGDLYKDVLETKRGKNFNGPSQELTSTDSKLFSLFWMDIKPNPELSVWYEIPANRHHLSRNDSKPLTLRYSSRCKKINT